MKKASETERILSLLGLAKRAGRITAGVPLICEKLRSPSPPDLVVIAEGAAENAKKRLSDKCAFYRIRSLRIDADPAELAHSLGRADRVAGAAVSDKGLARLIAPELFPDQNNPHEKGA